MHYITERYYFLITILYVAENKTLIASDCNSKNDRYLCENQRCILLNTVCDKKDDCGDKSDEGVGCENGILSKYILINLLSDNFHNIRQFLRDLS